MHKDLTASRPEAATDGAVGRFARLNRRAARLTIVDMSELTGYSVSHISKVESGERPVTRALVQRYDAAIDLVRPRS